jgi:hypothetical protein
MGSAALAGLLALINLHPDLFRNSIANTGSAGNAIYYADTTEQVTVLWDSAPGIPTPCRGCCELEQAPGRLGISWSAKISLIYLMAD